MGCDIHIIAEVKENGVWKKNSEKIFPNSHFKKDSEHEWEVEQFHSDPDDWRHYDWFAILANVRNGYGFAGVVTGEGFNVISQPRGIPNDCCEEWKQQCEQWRGDFHSHSYLYLDDFNKFDWNQVTMKRGVVTLNEYASLRKTNEAPQSWCGGVFGGGIITISEEEADKQLINKTINKQIYVNYHWPVLYREWFEGKIKNVVEPLRLLANKYEDVRLVFAFDN